MAGKYRWKEYIAFYRPSNNVTRQCQYLTALISSGRKKEAMQDVEPIWLHGKSQPRACDPVFKAWAQAGHRTTELVWQRIALAMEAGQWRLAKYLGRTLSDRDRVLRNIDTIRELCDELAATVREFVRSAADAVILESGFTSAAGLLDRVIRNVSRIHPGAAPFP